MAVGRLTEPTPLPSWVAGHTIAVAGAEPDLVPHFQPCRGADEVLGVRVMDDRLHLERPWIDPRDVARRVSAEFPEAFRDALRRRAALPGGVQRAVGLPADVVRMEIEVDDVLLDRRLAA